MEDAPSRYHPAPMAAPAAALDQPDLPELGAPPPAARPRPPPQACWSASRSASATLAGRRRDEPPRALAARAHGRGLRLGLPLHEPRRRARAGHRDGAALGRRAPARAVDPR